MPAAVSIIRSTGRRPARISHQLANDARARAATAAAATDRMTWAMASSTAESGAAVTNVVPSGRRSTSAR